MGNLKMKVEALCLYVLKDEFSKRYIKHIYAGYTLTTDSVFEAKLYSTWDEAEDYLSKPYTIKKVYFDLLGNMVGHDVNVLESDLKED
ncbi:MAG: hypothetical protein IJK61_03820 [Bacteroidetes bacterium]|nr:hypothetical protein [Bacteroidota bacterium]